MNYVNCALLVVVLILVIVCCIKKPSKEGFKSSTRNYTCTSISLPPGKDTSGNSLWTGSAGNWGSTYTNNSKYKTYRATRQTHCDDAKKKDAETAATAATAERAAWCDKRRECVGYAEFIEKMGVGRAGIYDSYWSGFESGSDGCGCGEGGYWVTKH
jgi:hypothetical protein